MSLARSNAGARQQGRGAPARVPDLLDPGPSLSALYLLPYHPRMGQPALWACSKHSPYAAHTCIACMWGHIACRLGCKAYRSLGGSRGCCCRQALWRLRPVLVLPRWCRQPGSFKESVKVNSRQLQGIGSGEVLVAAPGARCIWQSGNNTNTSIPC